MAKKLATAAIAAITVAGLTFVAASHSGDESHCSSIDVDGEPNADLRPLVESDRDHLRIRYPTRACELTFNGGQLLEVWNQVAADTDLPRMLHILRVDGGMLHAHFDVPEHPLDYELLMHVSAIDPDGAMRITGLSIDWKVPDDNHDLYDGVVLAIDTLATELLDVQSPIPSGRGFNAPDGRLGNLAIVSQSEDVSVLLGQTDNRLVFAAIGK